MPTHELKSPVSGKTLEAVILESGLNAYRCPESGGLYITANDYLGWLQQQPARLPHLPANETTVTSDANSTVKICPESGTLMTRYKVGHGFTFSIDRSITGGIWLDSGEWEALKQRNFHDEIHLVFTAPWQKHIRTAQSLASYEETLKSALGQDFFDRLTSLRLELADHPHRNLALSYLVEKSNKQESLSRVAKPGSCARSANQTHKADDHAGNASTHTVNNDQKLRRFRRDSIPVRADEVGHGLPYSSTVDDGHGNSRDATGISNHKNGCMKPQ